MVHMMMSKHFTAVVEQAAAWGQLSFDNQAVFAVSRLKTKYPSGFHVQPHKMSVQADAHQASRFLDRGSATSSRADLPFAPVVERPLELF